MNVDRCVCVCASWLLMYECKEYFSKPRTHTINHTSYAVLLNIHVTVALVCVCKWFYYSMYVAVFTYKNYSFSISSITRIIDAIV